MGTLSPLLMVSEGALVPWLYSHLVPGSCVFTNGCPYPCGWVRLSVRNELLRSVGEGCHGCVLLMSVGEGCHGCVLLMSVGEGCRGYMFLMSVGEGCHGCVLLSVGEGWCSPEGVCTGVPYTLAPDDGCVLVYPMLHLLGNVLYFSRFPK